MKKMLAFVFCALFVFLVIPTSVFATAPMDQSAAQVIIERISRFVAPGGEPFGFTGYPDYYAGLFIDGASVIVLVTREDEAIKSALIEAAGTDQFTIKKVERSLNDLTRLMLSVNDKANQLQVSNESLLKQINMSSCYVDARNNCVEVTIVQLDKEKEALFRQCINSSPAIKLVRVEHGIEVESPVVVVDLRMDELLQDVGAILLCAQVNSDSETSGEITVQVKKVIYQQRYLRKPLENACFTLNADGKITKYNDAWVKEASANAPQLLLLLDTLPIDSSVQPTAMAVLNLDSIGKLSLKSGDAYLSKYAGKTLGTFLNEVSSGAQKNANDLARRINAADLVALTTVRSADADKTILDMNRIYKGKVIPFLLTLDVCNRTQGEKILVFLRYDRRKKEYIQLEGPSLSSEHDFDFYYLLSRLDKLTPKPFRVPDQPGFGSVRGYEQLKNARIGALDSRFTIDAAAPVCAQTRLVYEWESSTDVVGNARLDPAAFALIYKFADEKAAYAARDYIFKTPVYEGSYDVIPVAVGTPSLSPQGVGEGIVPWLMKGDTIVCIQKGSGAAYKTIKNLSDLLVGQGYRQMV